MGEGKQPLGCGRFGFPGSLLFHLRWGFTVAFLSWPLVLGAHYGWFWFPGGWPPQLMPALLTAAFAAVGVYVGAVRYRDELELLAGSVRKMWPAVTVAAVAVMWAAPMALLSWRGFVYTFSNDYLAETEGHLIIITWVFMSLVALWSLAALRHADRAIAREEAAAAEAAEWNAISPGDVWFAVPPLRSGNAGDMKERPCIVLEAPTGVGVRCVSCTSQSLTAQRRGYPRLDTSEWPTDKDETFVRIDMVDVVPVATFRQRITRLTPEELSTITRWVRRSGGRTV